MSLGLVVLEENLFTRTRTRTPTPQSDDIKMKQYKAQETFTVNNVSYVKVQIMLVEKQYLREKISVNNEAVKFIN